MPWAQNAQTMPLTSAFVDWAAWAENEAARTVMAMINFMMPYCSRQLGPKSPIAMFEL